MPETQKGITKQTAIKIVKNFIIACQKMHISFDKVILFGSAAKNKTHEYSDIDVAFISDIFKNNPITDRRILNKVILTNDSFIDIESHPYPTTYFKQGDPFIDEIKRTGIEIKLEK
jgi:uncharacterized protein